MTVNIKGYDVLVDDESVSLVNAYKWRVDDKGNRVYFSRRIYIDKKKTYASLHRILADCKNNDGKVVDHINGNTLDNRKCNLRVCTMAENTRNRKMQKNNTSGIKGVSYNKRDKRWTAHIRINNKQIHLGNYIDKYEAFEAYKKASVKYHGEYGRVVASESAISEYKELVK